MQIASTRAASHRQSECSYFSIIPIGSPPTVATKDVRRMRGRNTLPIAVTRLKITAAGRRVARG
jgi:hypothetical protein